jgi:hypothetical protein
MATLGMILTAIGGIMAVVGGIWVIVLAFRSSILWGLLSLFISPVAIYFAIKNWAIAKRPFLIEIAGVVIMIIGIALSSTGMTGAEAAALVRPL